MEQTRLAFAELVAPGSGELNGNLDQAALRIAQALDPSVDVAAELSRLDDLAAQCDVAAAPELAIRLFGGVGQDPDRHFVGNRADYYDLDNSLLPRVLDRRLGIPITLALLLIEVARRKGIHLHGVGMPGHFLVRSAEGFIDPFNGGVLLDEAGCLELFQGLAGPNANLPKDALAHTPPALIVKRMLFNIAGIGTNDGQRRVLRAARSLLAVFPDADYRDHVQHAYAAAGIGQFGEAAAAAERALPMVPESVQHKLAAQIGAWQAQLN